MTKSHDNNNNNVLGKVQAVIATAIAQVAKDYDTLFAVAENKNADETADDSAAAELLSQRHKYGKVILSHLEALLKINATYIETSQPEVPEDYKDLLVQTARKGLKEES